MKTSKKLLASLTLAFATAVAAPAFAYSPDCMGMRGGPGHERMGERMKQHQQRLHDALKLTPEQEKAWTKFQESSPHAKMAKQRPARADLEKLSAPERAERMLEMQRQHQEAMTKHVAALKEFYDQLTPEQKKTFDEHAMPQRRSERRGAGPAAPAPAPAK